MHVQSLSIIINDPLMLPCVASHFEQAVNLIGPAEAGVVGVGHFEMGEPLVAKMRPPTSAAIQLMLNRLLANVVLAASVGNSSKPPHSYDVAPFRYRNWFFNMAGSVEQFKEEDAQQLAIPTYIARNIRGHTVPEAMFHQFLAYLHRQGLLAGDRWDLGPLRKALNSVLSREDVWFGTGESPDLSMTLSDGAILLGAAVGRPVYVRVVDGVKGCLACGSDVDGRPVDHPHVRGAVILDTEGLPSEEWQTVGPNRLFQVDTNLEFETFSL